MNEKQLQSIKITSLKAVQSLYTQDYVSVFPLLHADVTWIGSADSQYCQGKPAVTKLLASLPLSSPLSAPPFSDAPSAAPRTFALPPSVSLSCQLLYADLESCAALCICSSALRLEYCVTFFWKICREGARIYHVHASKSPYEREPVLTFTGRRAECFYLKPSDILYAEADNVCTSLVCSFGTLQARQSISAVKDLLPDYFLQIHRSFLVNIRYIIALRRYTLELRGGIQLPIPEKKYKWLKDYLGQTIPNHPGYPRSDI